MVPKLDLESANELSCLYLFEMHPDASQLSEKRPRKDRLVQSQVLSPNLVYATP
jgi:hypothetical protein